MSRIDPSGPPAPRPHAVTAAMFARFAGGGGGPQGARVLADAEYSRRLMTLWAVRDATARYGGDVGRRGREAWCQLVAAQRRSPAAVRALITYPSVGPALLRSLHALSSPGGRHDARSARDPGHALATLAAAAVAATGLPARAGVALHDGQVILPRLGAACFPGLPDGTWAVVEGGPSGARVTAGGQRIDIGTARRHPGGAAAWQGLRTIVPPADPGGPPGGGLLLDDVDPYCAPFGGRCERLTDTGWRPWRQVLAAGWELLETEHPEVAAEAAVVLRALVPVSGPPGSTRSGSSKETFGAAALTIPATAEDLALTLTHELQHNKLSALLHLFDLTAERPGELFYAPWREDPRPLVGLLHGAYAHVGVARFWHRRLSHEHDGTARHEAQVQFARWRDGAGEATGTLLASGRLTNLGVRFVTRMRHVLDVLARTAISPAAVAESTAAAVEHRRLWSVRHGAAGWTGQPG